MNSGVITATAAIAGSLVGAFGSATPTWITARHQDRRNLLGQQIARREMLYSDVECFHYPLKLLLSVVGVSAH
jgi:hypothetical protein